VAGSGTSLIASTAFGGGSSQSTASFVPLVRGTRRIARSSRRKRFGRCGFRTRRSGSVFRQSCHGCHRIVEIGTIRPLARTGCPWFDLLALSMRGSELVLVTAVVISAREVWSSMVQGVLYDTAPRSRKLYRTTPFHGTLVHVPYFASSDFGLSAADVLSH
jgi:hypothetical protein